MVQGVWGSASANYINGEIHVYLYEGDYLQAGAPMNSDDARAIANMLNQAADEADQDKEIK